MVKIEQTIGPHCGTAKGHWEGSFQKGYVILTPKKNTLEKHWIMLKYIDPQTLFGESESTPNFHRMQKKSIISFKICLEYLQAHIPS